MSKSFKTFLKHTMHSLPLLTAFSLLGHASLASDGARAPPRPRSTRAVRLLLRSMRAARLGLPVLYDIDDLQAAVGENIKKRSEEAEKARTIVEEEVEGFEAWLASLDVQPAVVALRQAFHEIMASELERAKLADLTDEQQERVAVLLRQFTNKLLHAPTTQLKASAEQGDGAAHVDSLIQLFNLSEVIREGLERGLDARKVQG